LGISKIKTIVIVALVLINLLFLSLIIIDSITVSRNLREEIELASAVLIAEGIDISPNSIRVDNSIRAMRTSRDSEAELRIAQAVLGDVNVINQGLIFRYESEQNGVAMFYSAGDFEILLNEGTVGNAGGAVRVVENILREMDIVTVGMTTTNTPTGEVVTVTGAYRDGAIFNNTIEFSFGENGLEGIRGRYVSGFEPIEDGTTISSIGTVMLGFLSKVINGESDTTMIASVEAGFQFRPSGAIGEGIIVPAWLIITDTGHYLTDCETGEMRLLRAGE
jgi:hypothetical protein